MMGELIFDGERVLSFELSCFFVSEILQFVHKLLLYKCLCFLYIWKSKLINTTSMLIVVSKECLAYRRVSSELQLLPIAASFKWASVPTFYLWQIFDCHLFRQRRIATDKALRGLIFLPRCRLRRYIFCPPDLIQRVFFSSVFNGFVFSHLQNSSITAKRNFCPSNPFFVAFVKILFELPSKVIAFAVFSLPRVLFFLAERYLFE